MKNHTHIYKTTLLILYLIFSFSYLSTAQPNRDRYRDRIWMFGAYSWHNYALIFNNDGTTDTLSYSTSNPIRAVSTSLCDTAGNLICYSNGIYIADKTHQKMRNGDSLDYGFLWQYNQTYGHSMQESFAMTLPISCPTNCAALIYINSPSSVGSTETGGVNIAYIDFSKNNFKGAVVQKDLSILVDTLASTFADACRHANGRDWWYIATKWGSNKYYRFLLSPYGVTLMGIQVMPSIPKRLPDGNPIAGRCAKYSPNGQIYAQHFPDVGTYLYDFDRCTGELSNRQLIPLAREFRTPFCGIEFSPNSRYMYVTSDTSIVQYDMQAPNIPASGIVVANYDGFADNGVFNTAFYLLQLAPNGKIYGACTGSNRYLHIIHTPNERGLACNVAQHGLMLPTKYSWTMPNFPYFRLGSEPGTVCDSLGIETGVTDTLATHAQNPPKGDFQLSVSPNPTSDECVVNLTGAAMSFPFGGQRGLLRLFSANGRLLETFANPFLTQNAFTINLKKYAVGVYIVEYEGVRTKVVRQ